MNSKLLLLSFLTILSCTNNVNQEGNTVSEIEFPSFLKNKIINPYGCFITDNEGESCQGFEGKENQYIGWVSNSKYSFDVIIEATRDKFGETHIHKYSDNLDEATANLMKDVNDDPYIVEKEAARIKKEVLDKFTK